MRFELLRNLFALLPIFPEVSYVLAYDPERVIQALGSTAPESQRKDFGRAYLEKIVQLQIPLPAIFHNEINKLLTDDLRTYQSELRLPKDFQNIERFQSLMEIFAEDVTHTLRDIRRLIETFRVLRNMLYGEVDWIDLLGYSALLIKAPETIERMRRDPDDYLGQPTSSRSISKHIEMGKRTFENRLVETVPESEQNESTYRLLAFLFPYLSEGGSPEHEYADAICRRRPLSTTLRLGLLPGAISREEVDALVSSSPETVKDKLHRAYDNDILDQLIDRLNDTYAELGSISHLSFWEGVSEFVKKPNCEWMISYDRMPEIVRSFAGLLEYSVGKNEDLRKDAELVFDSLRNAGETELTSHWLRIHIHKYGLFGYNGRIVERWFLGATETEKDSASDGP